MPKKIGRNDSCPCGSGFKYKKCCLLEETANYPISWIEDDGIHVIQNDIDISSIGCETVSEVFQDEIRKSELWEMIVSEYGEKKADEIVKEMKVTVKN